MTNEKAIKMLEYIRRTGNGESEYKNDAQAIAIDMAIKALEQTPKTWGLDDAREDFMNDVYNALDFLPTNNEANRIIDSFDRVTSGLEQQTCEDCISRQAVLEGIAEWVAGGYADSEADISHISSLVTHLPSVTPKERTGWIPVSERLPETDGMFLTYIVNPYDNRLSYIMLCDYIRQTWCPVDETASSNVVAWMPLPEPYKAESEDSAKIDCSKTKCESCTNHNYCDFEPQESEKI